MGGIVFDINKTPDSMLEEAKKMLDEALAEDKPLKFGKTGAGSSTNNDDFEIPGDDFGDLSDFEIS